MMKFLATLSAHLNLVPTIVGAVQAFQAIGHSKESTLAKIGQIVQVSAAVGEAVPFPVVQSVASTVESIIESVYASAAPAPAAAATA